METNSRAVKTIWEKHCWRNGLTKKPSNTEASKDISGLDKAQRSRIEEKKFLADHPDLIDDDPLFSEDDNG